MLQSLVTAVLLVTAFASWARSTDAQPTDRFVVVNGVRLHYLEWGGTGDALLFLTSFGGSAHEFDDLAPKFTHRFRVLGLTRRGKPPSDQPVTGYDTRMLVEDIRAFLDAMKIRRVALAGYSIAGPEQTLFASTYPDRVSRLVYLDALSDPKSAHELATNPGTRYPLPLPDPSGPLGEMRRAARQADPDYTKVSAPALAFCVIDNAPYIPADASGELRAQLVTRYERFGRPFEEQQRARFRRDMKRGRIIELHDTEHQTFLHEPGPQAIVVREMLAFLNGPP